ncbi:GNAT family N-acetyltransferase [Paenibacillus flagellatus]|uniref:GNAT family N-acetyltransferase n=2 Tax=Paenibacillus flagellatus TaxID=2211139 RepID=A0A2V5K8W7_9BACL|nr:GNAT family N-acetyltransferase [Paenibacillus flagellatus]
MIRPHFRDIPQPAWPDGYAIRRFRAGDERHWARIEQAAGEFKTTDDALRRFRDEFGPHVAEMERRCLFVVDRDGVPVGTTTAWYGQWDGATAGRIHWVAVVPDHQGRKLAKPLLAQALRTLAEEGHDRAYLTTQTTSWKAVGLYLNYGFEPAVRKPACAEGWALAGKALNRTIPLE